MKEGIGVREMGLVVNSCQIWCLCVLVWHIWGSETQQKVCIYLI
jgi:hypothetical protein